MNKGDSITSTLEELTPTLERALSDSPMAPHSQESFQLRASQCGLATAALQLYLHDQYAITTQRLMIEAKKAPRNVNHRRQSHVILFHEPSREIIDPTYSQFMSHIGLTPKVAYEQNQEQYYPTTKIATYQADASDSLAASFSQHIHTVDQFQVIAPTNSELEPVGSLRGATAEQFSEVYEELWSLDGYGEFDVTEQHPDFQKIARQVAIAMTQDNKE